MELLLLLAALVGIWFLSRRLPVSKREVAKPTRKSAFKTQYGLSERQPISQFEKRMIDGISQERNEVWVTAFCKGSEVLVATANVGSRFKCGPSDDVAKWPERAYHRGATQIRQYHSHPFALGCSIFSSEDRKTHRELHDFLERHELQFDSYLIYPGILGSYRIKHLIDGSAQRRAVRTQSSIQTRKLEKRGVAYAYWSCLFDFDSCPVCKSRDGLHWIPGIVNVGNPPLHSCRSCKGCRCIIVYVMKNENGTTATAELLRELGGRASKEELNQLRRRRGL